MLIPSDLLPSQLPEPLLGRKAHLGGIESILLNDQQFFFGFDYRNDLVLSPLMAEVKFIAHFASAHMLQRDGPHDVAYWREMAESSREHSDLASGPLDRAFSTQHLAETMVALRQTQQSNEVIPELALPYHLRYLLAAAAGWDAVADAFDGASENISIIRGDKPPPTDTPLSTCARALESQMGTLVNSAPNNWRTLFAALVFSRIQVQ
jgi:hypothetical protein